MPETREALAEFVTLDDPDVDDLLADLGRNAQAIVPDLVGLSLGLAHEGLTFTLLASSIGVGSIDAAQYVEGGPCVEVTEGRLDRDARNELLAEMTDDVAGLVLDDNRAQNAVLGVARAQAPGMIRVHRRFVADLEAGDYSSSSVHSPSPLAFTSPRRRN